MSSCIRSGRPVPYVWLQTQDSKATAFTRLLFAMKPWYATRAASARRPAGGDRGRPGGRLASLGVAGAARRARSDVRPIPPRVHRLMLEPGAVLEWARSDPQELLRPRRYLAANKGPEQDPGGPAAGPARHDSAQSQEPADPRDPPVTSSIACSGHAPRALVEGVQILIDHPEAVVRRADPLRLHRSRRRSAASSIGICRRDRAEPCPAYSAAPWAATAWASVAVAPALGLAGNRRPAWDRNRTAAQASHEVDAAARTSTARRRRPCRAAGWRPGS